MPDPESGTYSTAERASYRFPPCEQCGGRTIGSWIDAGDMASTEPKWIPGTYRCALACGSRPS